MSSSEGRPSPSSNDHGPVINIVTWLLLVATVLTVIIRMATKQAVSRRFSSDDTPLCLALLFSIGQSVMTLCQTANGLGQHQNKLTSSKINNIWLFDYIGNLLFLFNLCLTKIAILLLLRRTTPSKSHKKSILGLGIIVLLWVLTAEIASAFSCHLPHPWDYTSGMCFNRTAFWNYVQVVNILTDVALVSLCFHIVWNVQINKRRRCTVAGFFVARVLVVATIVIQLIFLNRISDKTQDLSFNTWQLNLSTLFVQNLSVITACVPSLKPFFDSLETGFIGNNDLRRRTEGIYSNPGPKTWPTVRKSRAKTPLKISGTLSSKPHEPDGTLRGNSTDSGTLRGNVAAAKGGGDWDAESHSSHANFIKVTKTWTVEGLSESHSEG